MCVCVAEKPFAVCNGVIPTIMIMNPELIREVLTRKFEFQKPEVGPTMKYFLRGLANIDEKLETNGQSTRRSLILPSIWRS